MAEFLHRKSGSAVWYYRRRYPKDVAQAINKSVFMQSLQTSVKRDAQQLARVVSVRFDEVCQQARLTNQIVEVCSSSISIPIREQERADSVLAKVPSLIRRGALMVVEEQQRNPRDWPDAIRRVKDFYEAMKLGQVPIDAYLPPVHAQAILNGIESVLEGKPLPLPPISAVANSAKEEGAEKNIEEPWPVLCDRALSLYCDKVGSARYQLAKRRLPDVRVQGSTVEDIQAGLTSWCKERLEEVEARTVKGQLDCMVSALRCVLPRLETPALRQLKGVMQPRPGDRQSMPVNAIKEAIEAFKRRPKSSKVRRGYEGGASQFDDIAIETLAVLGMRPRELIQAGSGAIVTKLTTFNEEGLFFRISDAKNRASERDIPLGDSTCEIVDVSRLREMLAWQEENPRSPHGAVSSLSTRFNKMTKGYTLYQMRHSWKDLAVNAGVDFELRERILGHAVRGVAAVYGSGIPLDKGLDALREIRKRLFD